MAFALKQNEAEARERLRAFWERSSLGRPALYVVADNPDFQLEPWAGGDDPVESKDHDRLVTWHAWRTANALNSTVFLAEAMPGMTLGWGRGLASFAALAGGDYEFYGNDAWIQPLPDIWERPLPCFDRKSTATIAHERCLRAIADVVGNRGFVNPPILMDGMTMLSKFRTSEQLCLDLIERPADVRRWSEALTTLYLEAFDHFYRLLRDWGYGDTSSWLQVMAEGRMEAVQTDFSVMISPEMYAEFALPDLRRLTNHFDYTLYHMDGTCQMRFLHLLHTLPHLNGIQWNPEPSAGSLVDWIDSLREIRAHNFALLVYSGSVDEASQLTRALGPDGLMLRLPRFATVAEAEQAIREIARCC